MAGRAANGHNRLDMVDARGWLMGVYSDAAGMPNMVVDDGCEENRIGAASLPNQ